MTRAFIVGTTLCAVLAVGCGRHQGETNNSSTATNTANPFRDQAGTRPQPVDVRGCLTASGDQFVLTQLRDASSANNPTTDTFQLTKTADQAIDLKQYVGKEVRVAGEADPARVADVREGDAATPAATNGQAAPPATTSATAGKATPRVGTTEESRFVYRKLAVSSVTPTGNDCPAAEPQAR